MTRPHIVTHSDRAPTPRERLDRWDVGTYRQRRDAERAAGMPPSRELTPAEGEALRDTITDRFRRECGTQED